MSFEIREIAANGLEIIILEDESSGTRAEVIPAFGGLLNSFYIKKDGGEHNIIDGYMSREDLLANLPVQFKSARLSPFVCRLQHGSYHYRKQKYIIQKRSARGEVIHGLLYDEKFAVHSMLADETKAELVMWYLYEAKDPGYPFIYSCELHYILYEKNRLEIITILQNHTSGAIPISDGWHPYFTTGTPVDELELQFNANTIVEFDQHLIPTGRVLPFDEFINPQKIGSREMDNSFLFADNAAKPFCHLHDPVKNITVSILPDVSYPVLQIFIPPHRKSIAIENLSAVPDVFNNKTGLIELQPGEAKRFSITYGLS
jgi:aldose 1-epimerase